MSGNGNGAVAAASRREQPSPAGDEPTPADLERLAEELVRKLGAQRARFLASLLDERADEAEGGG